MPLNPEISRFIREHLDDNPDQLLWKKNEYPDDRVVVAVEQIQARENIKEKLPSWYACQNIFYPSKLSTEQCSSETTAPYKARLTTGNSLCDLTGGLGVDTYFFSRQVDKVTYVEREQPTLRLFTLTQQPWPTKLLPTRTTSIPPAGQPITSGCSP